MPVSSNSNIWLYAFSADDPHKKDLAQASSNIPAVVSGQVVNEVCVNLIKRAKFPEVKISKLIETLYQNY